MCYFVVDEVTRMKEDKLFFIKIIGVHYVVFRIPMLFETIHMERH